ncbi:outer membrane protein TolC [Roseivirga pacifica]|uniref:Outer membrane protein TolC n=1 Tax=Roseivirga pacifica TaxID=1267423 RepID=A0A1I0RH56_9BACT|nr:TolC family protein [Roseivirga pacifica]RKQ49622.1 outer membrane protein TolC [Roseivirga pacifica]SEW40233.1 Outer membrane protein TolC [Roseivirga pacifica]
MKKTLYTAILSLFALANVQAQTTLTLEECINIALENNLSLKRARNSSISAKAQMVQSKMNFLPSLSAGASYNWNEGLQFDQTSGNLVNTTTLSGGGSLNASMVIFNGMSNIYNAQRANFQYQAAEETVRNTELQTERDVVVAFLDLISTREQLKIANQTNDLYKEQLEREEKRERAGVGNMEQVYNFRSQIAQQELIIVTRQNQLQSQELRLIQLLLLDPSDNYEFAGITVNDAELEAELEAYATVYDNAREFSPSLRSAELALQASKKSYRQSQFTWMPSLSVGASYGTGWSSNVKAQDGTVLDLSDQFRNNEYKSAGLNLNIPLFTRFQNRTQMQVSKINYLNSELTLQDTENQLRNQVQQAYLDLLNAKSTYAAAKESLVNLETSFEFSKTRYDNGTVDFVTYLENVNARNVGELTLTQSKYAILIRQMVLDIYTGQFELANK